MTKRRYYIIYKEFKCELKWPQMASNRKYLELVTIQLAATTNETAYDTIFQKELNYVGKSDQ